MVFMVYFQTFVEEYYLSTRSSVRRLTVIINLALCFCLVNYRYPVIFEITILNTKFFHRMCSMLMEMFIFSSFYSVS